MKKILIYIKFLPMWLFFAFSYLFLFLVTYALPFLLAFMLVNFVFSFISSDYIRYTIDCIGSIYLLYLFKKHYLSKFTPPDLDSDF